MTVIVNRQRSYPPPPRRITKSLDKLLSKNVLRMEDRRQPFSRSTFANPIPGEGVDLLIEAVAQNITLKTKLLAEASQIQRDNAIIASNTSSISLTQLAVCTNRPDKVIGVHF